MVNFYLLLSESSVSDGPGGLFDFDATLPLVAVQFLLLMVILNVILYSPLLTIIDERKEYILNKLTKASALLTEVNTLTTQYEEELNSLKKEAQLEIINSQKIHKQIFEIELNISQKYIDNLLDTVVDDLTEKRTEALNSLETIVQSLSAEIETKLSL